MSMQPNQPRHRRSPRTKVEPTYRVVRRYQANGEANQILFTGKSLKWVQDYCSDPETSSRTCKQAHNVRHTLMNGAWFDAYDQE